MRHPAAVLTALTIALSGTSGLAQAVVSAPALGWWEEVGKYIVPPTITAAIAVLGFIAAFYVNDGLKRRELLYKERIESVKAVLSLSQMLAEETGKELKNKLSYDAYEGVLDNYLSNYRVISSSYLPLLKPMSQHASLQFNIRMRRVSEMRSHLLEAGEHLSTGKEGADIIQYHLDLLEIPMYVLTLTDVLYRDLEMPGWSAQFSESLRQFDVEYTEHQARKKENARLARNLPFKEEEFKVRL